MILCSSHSTGFADYEYLILAVSSVAPIRGSLRQTYRIYSVVNGKSWGGRWVHNAFYQLDL